MGVAIVHPKLAEACFKRAIRPLLDDREGYEKLGIKFLRFSFPFLDVELEWRSQNRDVAVRLDGTDFPYRPIGGWWIEQDGTALIAGQGKMPSRAGFHTSKLDGTPGSWFCFLGWRDYHDNTSHQDQSWAGIRQQPRYSPLQLLRQLQTDLNVTGTNPA